MLQFTSASRSFLGLLIFLLSMGSICAMDFHSVHKDNQDSYGVGFTSMGRAAGLNSKTIYGDEGRNRYLLETTGSGIAWFDFDNDGWLDIFVVNGARIEGFPRGQEPTTHLYRNNRKGAFTDVTRESGLACSGWGQAVCIGDYDNDGFDDLFVTYYGRNTLFKNNGDGTFADVSEKAGVAGGRVRWGSGAAFIDFDRDGDLDLFVANYIEMDLKTVPTPENGPCLYKGKFVACGPPGLQGGKNILYENDGKGHFRDVSEKSGITKAAGTYGLGVLVADFDNDSWPDIYVASDTDSSTLYLNNKDGTFKDIGIEAGVAYSPEGKTQAGMGVTAGDYDGDGLLDIFKTNFAGELSSLYKNRGVKSGLLSFDDAALSSGIGVNTRYLGWGCGFVDFDNDGWLDIFLVNGHVYPEVAGLRSEIGYAQKKILYRNLGNGNFKDISDEVGGPLIEPAPGRGTAFGDFDNDGDQDILINTINDYPELLRCDSKNSNNWITIKLIGVKSNRSAIGARLRLAAGDRVLIDEVRSGGSYYSQNDLRIHFGLGKSEKITSLEIQWPGGLKETLKDLPVNRIIRIREQSGVVDSSQNKAGMSK
jgi:hypothetical protein